MSSRILFKSMRVRVLFFGVLKEIFSRAEEELELPEGSTAGDLLLRVAGHAQAAQKALASSAVAVNREYAQAATLLHDHDEVALLPPVSGGSR